MIQARLTNTERKVTVTVAPPRKASPWELAFRITIVSALVICLGLAYWTFQRRLVPLQEKSRELTLSIGRLSDQVDTLQRKWTKEDIEQVRSQYNQLHTQLFANEAELRSWLMQLDQAAGPQVINLSLKQVRGATKKINELNLRVITAEVALEVQPLPLETESPYQRVLRFMQNLAAQGKRADLAELTVTGGTSSVTGALLVFNLWAGDEQQQAAK